VSNPTSRRQFLSRAGLTLAVAGTPASLKVLAMGTTDMALDVFRPGPWLQISPDDQVTIFLCKSEMGQGVHTAIPMIVADELEADWNKVKTEMAPVTAEYADPVTKSHRTNAASTMRNFYAVLRKLGAAGREILVAAAASKWNVPISECEAIQSQVYHKLSGRSSSYGALVEEAAHFPVPENPRLKNKSEFKLMGKPVLRRDIPAKVNGEARFGIDIFVPEMLYGVLAHPPAYGAVITFYDEQAAREVEGVQLVVETTRGIGILADTLDAAWKGRKALNVQWDGGAEPRMNTESVDQTLIESLNKKGISVRSDLSVQLENEGEFSTVIVDDARKVEAFTRSDRRVQAEYFLPYLTHAVMEPMDCTVHVRADRCDIWTPTQNQSRVQQVIVQITGLRPEQIRIHTPYLGGGFGRRGETFVVEEAVELSKAARRPVKLIWTREEDMKYGVFRPGYGHRIEASLDKAARVTAWSHKVAGPSVVDGLLRGIAGGPPWPYTPARFSGVDPFAVSAVSREFQYQVPALSVEYVRVDTSIPVRTWRSPSGSHFGFAVESFMDELAHAVGQDPVEFRLKHLEHQPRARRVITLAAEKAGWGKPLSRGEAQGIAMFFTDETYVAEVAEVSVNRKTGVVQVHRVVCVVDCGPVVNPDTVIAQMEGALTMGLSATLKEKVEFADGGVKSANFLDYPILRMSEAPDVDVHIVESEAKIGGAGEASLSPLAPAVANAVFSATGVRIRRLPMKPEKVLEALSHPGEV